MADSDIKDEDKELVDSPKPNGCRQFITLEPVAFLYQSALVMSTTMTQQYVNYAVAESYGVEPDVQSDSICSVDMNETSVADVQTTAADILFKFSLCNIFPMLVAAVLMGSYSDSGGRKVALIIPVLGGLIRGGTTLAVVFFGLDLRWLIAAGFVEGLSGGSAVFSTAAYAYIADVSKRNRRSWRMLVICLMESTGVCLAQITMGYLVTLWGFVIPFMYIVLVYTLCLLYVACFIHETVTGVSISLGYFNLKHFVRTFRVLVDGADAFSRWVMRCSSMMLFVTFIFQGIIGYSMTLYLTQYPLCFTWVMLGYHQGATALSKAILGTLLHLALHGTMGDIGLIILAGSLGVISKLWFAVPIYNIVYVYMECIVAAPIVLIDPVARALMSKAGSVDEQGAVQGLVAVVNVVGHLIGSPLAAYVYSQTAGFYTGAVFVLGAALLALIVSIALALRCIASRGELGDWQKAAGKDYFVKTDSSE